MLYMVADTTLLHLERPANVFAVQFLASFTWQPNFSVCRQVVGMQTVEVKVC